MTRDLVGRNRAVVHARRVRVFWFPIDDANIWGSDFCVRHWCSPSGPWPDSPFPLFFLSPGPLDVEGELADYVLTSDKHTYE